MPRILKGLRDGVIKHVLAHPLTRNLDIDDPSTTDKRRLLVRSKPFLRRLYDTWYRLLIDHLPRVPGAALELGSGPGFFANYVPGLITSEVFLCRDLTVVLDGRKLPMASGSLSAVTMTDVLHHLPFCREFFAEASRCLCSGGRILMIEPWVSPWSDWVFRKFHHEPFERDSPDWDLHEGGGPLSGANGALPWIIFERDREIFEREFPQFKIIRIQPMMPFAYLLSGGVTLRSLMPGFAFPLCQLLERAMEPRMKRWAMFALIVVEKK
jgi:hypothetical protein